MRFVGDAVAIVAGESEKAVDKALKLIKVKYQVLEPVLDIHTAKDNRILVHPEDNWRSLCPVGADNQRNLCASDTCATATWTRCWRTATRSSITFTTPRPASRR